MSQWHAKSVHGLIVLKNWHKLGSHVQVSANIKLADPIRQQLLIKAHAAKPLIIHLHVAKY